MQSITIRSRVGADGQLHLDIPTQLTNTDLEVTIWLRPVEPVEGDRQAYRQAVPICGSRTNQDKRSAISR